jgi:iron complex outermembrane receptor protein
MAKLTFKPSQDGKLTLIANTFRQEAQDPQGLTWSEFKANPKGVAFDSARGYYPALAFNTRKSIDHQQGGVTYEHRFGDQTVQLSAYVGQRSTIQYQSIPVVTQTNARHSGGVIDFDRTFAGASGRWIGRFGLAGGRLTTTVGVDFEQSTDDRRGYESFSGPTLGVKGALRRKEEDRVFSFDQYAQAEWQGERWTFSAGVRHSRVTFKVDDNFTPFTVPNPDDSGSVAYDKTTPTIAAMYRLTDAVNLYASAARGFEAPTFNEMFYSGAGGSFNLGLKPSNSTHYEAGVKAQIGNNHRVDAAIFQIQTDDEIVVLSSTGGRTAYQNAGPTTRRGFELSAGSIWSENLTSRIAYTYLDAKYDEGFTFTTPFPVVTKTVNAGNRLPGISAQTLFGELAWRHRASGFHAAVEGIARSKAYVEDTNADKAAPGYAIANLRFGVDRQYGALKLGTFLRLNNIFDRQYVGSVIVGDGNQRYYESAPGFNWLAGISARYAF